MKKALPESITSYDLLKSFAVVIMVIDHIGAYFYPDQLWWRAVGRIGFPVWFFLVGYSNGRDLSPKLLWGALILVAGNAIAGMPVFPLNALVTIALIRLLIDRVMFFSLKSRWHLWAGAAVMFVAILPTYAVCEYGTQALITAVFGYMVRHRKKIPDQTIIFNYMIFALFSFVLMQKVAFGFSWPQFVFMALGTALVRLYLYRYFDLRTYPRLTTILPAPMVLMFQFMGRHTLEIYVVHLLLFKALAMAFFPDKYVFLGGGIFHA